MNPVPYMNPQHPTNNPARVDAHNALFTRMASIPRGTGERRAGECLAMAIAGLLEYEKAYRQTFEDCELGQDYALGPEWRAALHAVHRLLNGPTGAIDCGSASTQLVHRFEGGAR